MDIVEKLVREFGRKVTHDGAPALVTNGIPVMEEAFNALGWSDPYILPPMPEPEPKPEPEPEPVAPAVGEPADPDAAAPEHNHARRRHHHSS